jgi:hypothetical protein
LIILFRLVAFSIILILLPVWSDFFLKTRLFEKKSIHSHLCTMHAASIACVYFNMLTLLTIVYHGLYASAEGYYDLNPLYNFIYTSITCLSLRIHIHLQLRKIFPPQGWRNSRWPAVHVMKILRPFRWRCCHRHFFRRYSRLVQLLHQHATGGATTTRWQNIW